MTWLGYEGIFAPQKAGNQVLCDVLARIVPVSRAQNCGKIIIRRTWKPDARKCWKGGKKRRNKIVERRLWH
jgi:hypothetical protein